MRVLFDGYWWDKGPTANRSVQRDIITEWARLFPTDDITVAVRAKARPADLPDTVGFASTKLWPHALSNGVELRRIARTVKADVVISHNFAPRTPGSVVFIHDVMFTEHRDWFSRAERAYFSRMLPMAKRAALIATSTETERTRIAGAGSSLPDVIAVGLGIPSALANATPQRPIVTKDVDEFALTVGRLNVRKNLGAVIDGAVRSGRINSSRPLIIVGSAEHSGVDADLPTEVAEHVSRGTIAFAGFLSDSELAWLYQNALVTVTLSLDEGFGLPPVEAAHFGSSVVASDIPVHRETVGDYAFFVDPLAEPAAIADAITSAIDANSAEALAENVRQKYSWTNVVTALRTASEAVATAPRGKSE